MLAILTVCMMLVMRVGRLIQQGVAVDEIVVLGLVVVIVSVVGFGGVEVIIRGQLTFLSPILEVSLMVI